MKINRRFILKNVTKYALSTILLYFVIREYNVKLIDFFIYSVLLFLVIYVIAVLIKENYENNKGV